jgi:hypothetical protein
VGTYRRKDGEGLSMNRRNFSVRILVPALIIACFLAGFMIWSKQRTTHKRLEDVKNLSRAYAEAEQVTNIDDLIRILARNGIHLSFSVSRNASVPSYRLVVPKSSNLSSQVLYPNQVVIEEINTTDGRNVVVGFADGSVSIIRAKN